MFASLFSGDGAVEQYSLWFVAFFSLVLCLCLPGLVRIALRLAGYEVARDGRGGVSITRRTFLVGLGTAIVGGIILVSTESRATAPTGVLVLLMAFLVLGAVLAEIDRCTSYAPFLVFLPFVAIGLVLARAEAPILGFDPERLPWASIALEGLLLFVAAEIALRVQIWSRTFLAAPADLMLLYVALANIGVATYWGVGLLVLMMVCLLALHRSVLVQDALPPVLTKGEANSGQPRSVGRHVTFLPIGMLAFFAVLLCQEGVWTFRYLQPTS